MDSLMQDLRYGLRSLGKSPAFTTITVLVLALGIGANTAMFSVVNAVLLRELPYRDPSRLVMLWEHRKDSDDRRNVVGPANFLLWRDQAASFESMAPLFERDIILGGEGGESEPVRMRATTSSLFPMLGVRPSVGRLFAVTDDAPGAPSVAVLSDGIWRRRFGARTDIIGRSVTLGGLPYTVIGVLPRGSSVFEPVDLYVPLIFLPAHRTVPGRFMRVIARLKPGATLDAAQAEMASLARRQVQLLPDIETNWTTNVVPLQDDLVGRARPALLVLAGAVAFLLLIACANVANLLLARAAGREREIAIRMSLGATPRRLFRQLITESVTLSLCAAVVGLVLAYWGTSALVALLPAELPVPRASEIGLDARVLAFTVAVALLTGALFGLAPALATSRASVHDSLKESGRSNSAGRRRGRLRGALVIAELSLAMILLAGAGLMVRSFAQLQAVDPGFDARGVLVGKIGLLRSHYSEPLRQVAAFRNIEERIAGLPGVLAVGAISFLPLSGERSATSVQPADRPAPPKGQEPVGDMRAATPGYFRAIGIPLRQGRLLSSSDDERSPDVAVVSRTLAQTFWPNQSAVGKRIVYEWDKLLDVEIVGVVGDVHHTGLDATPKMEIYRPLAQMPYGTMTLVVRGAASDPLILAAPVRAAVREVDPDQAIASLKRLSSYVDDSLGKSRLSAMLFGTFAILGLVLAIVGIYGVISYGVTQRTHEIGVRMALGARGSDVVSLVVGQGAWLVVAGIGVGLAGAMVLTRLMTSLLFEVTPGDPPTYAAIVALLAGVALLASYIPARRATHIDPLIALRQE
ncbi:MAG: ABC transporter permease [Gemmatimonadota bacterium]|nr:ABC transporter permease [Gemmatimonadota bacterium]